MKCFELINAFGSVRMGLSGIIKVDIVLLLLLLLLLSLSMLLVHFALLLRLIPPLLSSVVLFNVSLLFSEEVSRAGSSGPRDLGMTAVGVVALLVVSL